MTTARYRDASEVASTACDLGYQLERTSFLVAAAGVEAGGRSTLALRDGDVTVRRYTIDVTALAWVTSAFPPDATPPGQGPLTVVDGPHVVADYDALAELDAGLVGLQAVPESHANVYGTSYVITFVTTQDDERAQFVSGDPPTRCDDAFTALTMATGITSLKANLDMYQTAIVASNAGDSTMLQRYYEAIEAAMTEPEPTWWDLSAAIRPLTPGAIPDELRPRLEAIGIDIRYVESVDPDGIGIGTGVIAIRSELGAVHAWSSEVGDHVALALRSPGEPLEVLIAPELDGDVSDEVVIGRIPASVPAGHVAVVELVTDPLALTYVATRPPTESELAAAAGHGIDTTGRFTD